MYLKVQIQVCKKMLESFSLLCIAYIRKGCFGLLIDLFSWCNPGELDEDILVGCGVDQSKVYV